MAYSNSRDMSKVAQKRTEWASWGSRPDTEIEIAEKAAKLEINLDYIAALRSGVSRDDARDLCPCAHAAYDMGTDEDDSEMIDLIEKQCREKFAARV